MTRDEYLAFRDGRRPDLRHFARHSIPITATDLRLALEAIDYLSGESGPCTWDRYKRDSKDSAVFKPVKP